MQCLLTAVIPHATTYNLQLNQNKCQLLVMSRQPHAQGDVYFPDGTKVPQADDLKYLRIDTTRLIRRLIAGCMVEVQQLWRHGTISLAWKLNFLQ
eukprot:124195-Amphidinium_carterae.1